MASRRARGDARLDVSRYRVDRLSEQVDGTDADETAAAATPTNDRSGEADAGQASMDQRTQFVETAIDQAIRRGDFDGLPGAGRPLEGLDGVHDPDWWIRRKIEREKLTGLGPPALTLRTEDAGLDVALDALRSERDVRELLGEFNSRVIEARRQLQGGPPVVTSPRDVEQELLRWRTRRDERRQAAVDEQELRARERAAMTWRDRRRARRASRSRNP